MKLDLYKESKNIAEKEYYLEQLGGQERIFVDVFVQTRSISQAAKAAGINHQKALRWLRTTEKIKKAIQYSYDIINYRNQVSQTYFIEKLKEMVEDKKVRASDKINALKLLAELTGHLNAATAANNQMVVLKIDAGKNKKEVLPVINLKGDKDAK